MKKLFNKIDLFFGNMANDYVKMAGICGYCYFNN